MASIYRGDSLKKNFEELRAGKITDQVSYACDKTFLWDLTKEFYLEQIMFIRDCSWLAEVGEAVISNTVAYGRLRKRHDRIAQIESLWDMADCSGNCC